MSILYKAFYIENNLLMFFELLFIKPVLDPFISFIEPRRSFAFTPKAPTISNNAAAQILEVRDPNSFALFALFALFELALDGLGYRRIKKLNGY